ncbi:unnamed protein product [Lactuca saligna]|uniref:Uncharacterized protein n=1 Tax=Lactuca saligna TaxID=75948 RepID=A0AA35VN82_LACSI|nr:unnamed protein product [Lactuca saligna]
MSFKPYTQCRTTTKDSLFSEDITTQEWSSCAHPPATTKFLVGQSGACRAGDLRYVVAQASALMVVAADRVYCSGTNEAQIKTLQDAIASLKEELRDSESERRLLFEQNCIVAYEKVLRKIMWPLWKDK